MSFWSRIASGRRFCATQRMLCVKSWIAKDRFRNHLRWITWTSEGTHWQSDIARARQVPSARVGLRMWSDEVPFRDAGRKIKLGPEIVAVKGEPNTGYKGVPFRPARRHYVSFAETKLEDGTALDGCVNAILSALDSSAYASGTRSKAIDATLWIAVFRDQFAYQGAISEATIARARDLGVKLFIEDYTREGADGAPLKLWLS